jgi:HNH endonuclease
MDLKSLSDSQLMSELKNSVLEERQKTALVLEYLREVERRRLYADSGYPSLWDFCIHELAYSEASASRRIGAMRLLREIPELKEDLLSGKQNLSSLSKARNFFKLEEKHQGEKLSIEEKKEVLQELENKSSRECERTLLELSSVPIEISNPQRERPIDATHTELRLVLRDEVYFKLKRIQALRSHANPSMSYENLLDYMADEILKKIDPLEKVKSQKVAPSGPSISEPSRRPDPSKIPGVSKTPDTSEMKEVQNPDFFPPPTSEVEQDQATPGLRTFRIPIPRAIARTVWVRDQGRCSYSDPSTGKLCNSTVYLEYDHILPVSKGGQNRIDNLRLRCRAHNQREWIKKASNF